MDEHEFLVGRGFKKIEPKKYMRKRGTNKEYVDIGDMQVYVHDQNRNFVSIPQELNYILEMVERMQDMNQKQLDEWIDGLEKQGGQVKLTHFGER